MELRGHDAQDLDSAHHERDEDRDEGDVEVVVELADGLDVRPAVGPEHEDAVGRVDRAHPGREERGQDQDERDREVAGAGGGSQAEQRDLARRVEPEPEEDPERIHVPALADEPEHRPQESREQAPVVEEVLEALLVVRPAGRDLPEHPVDVEQDDEVDDPDDEQERPGDGRPDEAADLPGGRDVADDPGRDRDEDRQADHDRGVAQREEEPDADGSLAVLHELAGRVVDRRDVVGVDGVAETERVGQEGRREHDRVGGRARDRERPGDQVEDHEERVDRDDPVAQAAGRAEQATERGQHRGPPGDAEERD